MYSSSETCSQPAGSGGQWPRRSCTRPPCTCCAGPVLPSGRRRPRQPCRRRQGGIGFHGGFGRRFRNGHGILGLRGLRSDSGGRGRRWPGLPPLPRSWPGHGRSRLGSRLRCGLHYWGRGRLCGRRGNVLGNLLYSGGRGGRFSRSDLLCYGLGDRLWAAAFFTTALGAGLAAALDHRLGGAFFTGAALLTVFFTGAFLLAGWLGLGGRSGLLRHRLGCLDRRFLCGGLPGRRLRDAALVAGLLAGFLATGFAANFFTTGLAVFLAAVAAFFAVFSSHETLFLDFRGPGKRAFIAYPTRSSNPAPCSIQSWSQGALEGSPTNTDRLARYGTWPAPDGAGTGRRPSATCDQRPILHKCVLHANWHKMTG